MRNKNGTYRRACVIAITAIWLNAAGWAAEGKAQTPKYVDYVAELNKLGTGQPALIRPGRREGRKIIKKQTSLLPKTLTFQLRFLYHYDTEWLGCAAKRFIRLWRINMGNPSGTI